MTQTPDANEEIIMTSEHKVSCNGNGGALGHPWKWAQTMRSHAAIATATSSSKAAKQTRRAGKV